MRRRDWTEEKEIWPSPWHLWDGEHVERWMGEEGYLSKTCLQILSVQAFRLWRFQLFFAWCGRWGAPSQGQMCALALGRKEEGREILLCLWFLSCLQLKAVLRPKRPIVTWCHLIFFIPGIRHLGCSVYTNYSLYCCSQFIFTQIFGFVSGYSIRTLLEVKF